MKPPSGKKVPEVRVTRKSIVDLKHDGGHGWAVSYADLLLVLLSFFVLYFSFKADDPDTVDEQIVKIAMAMSGKAYRDTQPEKPGNIQTLQDLLNIEGLRVSANGDHLIVDLDSTAFNKAQYRLNNEIRTKIDNLITALDPFKDKIEMVVIGHADNIPLIPRNEFLTDNFDLSSVRALNALKYVLAKGFPENKASARAASSFDRNARSISFEVRLAKKGGEK